MKPEKIVMSAFGSYAEEVVIDFHCFQKQGLFLITGDTGSGKTTIFDAIIFALYGETSGVYKENSMLRSQYAKAEVPTYVELTFSYQGKLWRIYRNPSYERPAKRGNGVTRENAGARLECLESSQFTVTGYENVTNYIVELLGVSKEQYSQIAMIAQGDFMKLLMATTKQRTEIFREIFHTKVYLSWQERLKSESKALHSMYDDSVKSIRQYTDGVLCKPNSQWEDRVTHMKSRQNGKESGIFVEEWKQLLETLLQLDEEELGTTETELCKLDEEIQKGQIQKRDLELREKRENEYHQRLEQLNGVRMLLSQSENALSQAKSEAEQLEQISVEIAQANETFKKWEGLERLQKEKEAALLEIEKETHFIEEMDEKSRQAYELLKKEFEEKQRQYLEEEQKRILAEELFFQEQAGLLAQQLQDGKPCPVCGSLHHPAPAPVSGKAPDREELRRQKDLTQQLFQEVDQSSKAVAAKKQEYVQRIHESEMKLAVGKTKTEELQKQMKELQSSMEGENKEQWRQLLQAKILRKQELEENLEKATKQHQNNQSKEKQLVAHMKLLKEQMEELSEGDLSQCTLALQYLLSKRDEKTKQKQDISHRLLTNRRILKQISQQAEAMQQVEEQWLMVKALSNTANGNLSGKDKIYLETYVQMTYFDRMIARANRRFFVMSSGQYDLVRSENGSNQRQNSGFELNVIDHYSNTIRSVKTLSGGEAFLAALCLALGLADEIQQSAGGSALDAMFIDEGFGTLDEEALSHALKALADLSEGNRLVGIISHVDMLRDKIEKQIIVEKHGMLGSTVQLVH